MTWKGYESYLPPGLIGQDGRVQAQKPSEDDAISFQCRALKLPEPVREYRFAPPRRFRFDFCWIDAKLALEVQGGLFLPGGGRHNRGAAMLREFEKLNMAAQLGYRVLFTTPTDVGNGQAMVWVEKALRG